MSHMHIIQSGITRCVSQNKIVKTTSIDQPDINKVILVEIVFEKEEDRSSLAASSVHKRKKKKTKKLEVIVSVRYMSPLEGQ